MVVDDLDHHLARRHRADDVLADRLLAHRGDKVAHHRQRDIGLQQRDADFTHRGGDIVLAERAAAAQPVENPAETIAKCVEHAAYHAPTRCGPARDTRGPAVSHSREGSNTPVGSARGR